MPTTIVPLPPVRPGFCIMLGCTDRAVSVLWFPGLDLAGLYCQDHGREQHAAFKTPGLAHSPSLVVFAE